MIRKVVVEAIYEKNETPHLLKDTQKCFCPKPTSQSPIKNSLPPCKEAKVNGNTRTHTRGIDDQRRSIAPHVWT